MSGATQCMLTQKVKQITLAFRDIALYKMKLYFVFKKEDYIKRSPISCVFASCLKLGSTVY